MIGAAIQSLSEEGGSTIAAISRYIRSNYDDIPDGHNRLLPYYLSKLTAQGEFVITAPGRFAVADDGCAEPTLASSRPGPAKHTSSSKPIDDKGDDPIPGMAKSPPQSSSAGPGSSKSMVINGSGFAWTQPKSTAHEGDVIGRIESSATVSGPDSEGHAQPPSNRKKMAPQGDTEEPSEFVLALPWERPRVDGSKPVNKRRGRPSKNKAVLVDHCCVGSVDLDQGKRRSNGTDQEETNCRGDGSKVGPKSCGRPPKKKAVWTQNCRVGSDMGNLGRDEPEPMLTRAEHAGPDRTSSISKRRGRGRFRQLK